MIFKFGSLLSSYLITTVNLRGSRENLKHKILSIVLKSASGIEARHCVINLKEGIATLVPQSEDAMCMINAVTVNQPIRLYQGCVIVLGKTNMFRYVSHTFFFITFFFSFSHLNYMNILCTPQSNLLQRC